MDIRRKRSCRAQDSSASKEVLESNDLLLQILKFLPERSLLSCRDVCKHWRSAISSPAFFKIRRMILKPNGFLFLNRNNAKRTKFMYTAFYQRGMWSPYRRFPFGERNIIQSCNGLLLYIGHYKPVRECFVYNTTTNETATISIPGGGGYMGEMGLAFDPRGSPYYNVLFLKFPEGQVYVYSSEIRAWRRIETNKPIEKVWSMKAVYCCGMMYWVDLHFSYGLCFNIETNTLETLRFPNIQQNGAKSTFCYVGACADDIYLVEKRLLENKTTFVIYRNMGSNGSHWNVKYQLDYDANVPGHLIRYLGYRTNITHEGVLSIFEDEFNKFSILLSVNGAIVIYNLDDRRISNFIQAPGRQWFKALEYFNVICSV